MLYMYTVSAVVRVYAGAARHACAFAALCASQSFACMCVNILITAQWLYELRGWPTAGSTGPPHLHRHDAKVPLDSRDVLCSTCQIKVTVSSGAMPAGHVPEIIITHNILQTGLGQATLITFCDRISMLITVSLRFSSTLLKLCSVSVYCSISNRCRTTDRRIPSSPRPTAPTSGGSRSKRPRAECS